jgi:hypothetical protein
MSERPKIRSGGEVQINISILLTEIEARALHGMTVYGADEFVKVFYEHLGKTYMKDHEPGLRSLFQTVKEELPQHLERADKARAAFIETNKQGR